MGCPYHFEEPQKRKKKSNLPLLAGLAIGALSIGYTVMKNNPLPQTAGEQEGTDDMNIFNKQMGHEFYMPHFMIKNVRTEAADNALTIHVDYRINKVLNDYLINNRPTYFFKLILPEKYQSLFEEPVRVIKGEEIPAGSTRPDYTATFQFEAKPSTTAADIKAIKVSDKIQMTILDEKDNVLNDFPDVYNAANIIRY
ncbi:hypothetical protein [Macrococcus carouselicus]|uniref:Uncharacterized protein n=1 Tax=Macrococcus carouselicus TaxID=69969 RepID=A0A9Q8CJQ6_9STAP|nr:hypothetical protein [Macrococcus carouselicus]TDM00790.1 hypothetical protein ERX40_08235 [Macrococcus carouselicus]